MRFIHTADWHLGRQFHNVSLIDDQAHVLEQIISLANDRKADAVIVAGDIYDRAIPPADAVRLLDEVLRKLVIEAGIPVIMIAGNHDSADRLAFASELLAGQGLHLFGPLVGADKPVALEDDYGTVYFCPIPYADPGEVRLHTGKDDLHTHDAAVRALTVGLRSKLAGNARSVAIAHCWVTGGTSTESERPLTVGGSGEVGSDCFDGFQYTALGHLHRPQSIGKRNVHYSGSLLKYSFSEADHKKSVNIVEIDGKGSVSVERVELSPRRDLRIIEGKLESILRRDNDTGSVDDYLLVSLTDRGAILDAMGKLRQVYPNILHIERTGIVAGQEKQRNSEDYLKRSELDLYVDFHQEVVGYDLEKESATAFQQVVDTLRKEDREAS